MKKQRHTKEDVNTNVVDLLEKEIFFGEETKNKDGKGGKYLENANIFFAEERTNREGK